MSLLVRFGKVLSQIQYHISRSFEPFHPALAYNLVPLSPGHHAEPGGATLLDGVMDSILWAAVPKTRRSSRKRKTRRNGHFYVRQFMTPKRNILACLECGHYHEKFSICGNCYAKVRDETAAMQAAMGDTHLYNVPRSEIEIVYQEETPKSDTKYIVEMDKPRPGWFSKSLLTKSTDS